MNKIPWWWMPLGVLILLVINVGCAYTASWIVHFMP